MELILKDSEKTLSVSDKTFSCDFNEALIHQVICAYKAGARQGTCAQKSRSEVVGSGKKPWRQKGTGRARSGSVKSPIWRSGAVTFAAKTQNYTQKVNKKMYRGALKSIFSELIRQNRLIVVENFYLEKPKTKLLVQKLNNMSLENVLVIINVFNKNLFLASRNLYKISILETIAINPLSLISFETVIITSDAVKQVERVLQ